MDGMHHKNWIFYSGCGWVCIYFSIFVPDMRLPLQVQKFTGKWMWEDSDKICKWTIRRGRAAAAAAAQRTRKARIGYNQRERAEKDTRHHIAENQIRNRLMQRSSDDKKCFGGSRARNSAKGKRGQNTLKNTSSTLSRPHLLHHDLPNVSQPATGCDSICCDIIFPGGLGKEMSSLQLTLEV